MMRKASYSRGSFPMPWMSEGFFLPKEDYLFKEIQNAVKVSTDEVTTMGQGSGNVSKSVGKLTDGQKRLKSRETVFVVDCKKLLILARNFVSIAENKRAPKPEP